ncbi:AI-2E family transporter [Rhodopirellula sp. MGV]|uniref:AI-2E family transporter n=1 Tax=Rhodopirellula sp. MGV TaxID=2023130 RepID=UPI000B96CDD3|nr:AI-2E family transporter [Rhodopirellula sp. MGV]OYP33158.1 hypothetical protein CGZ80_18215 [Rhodopirellula sp. MGV]
MIETPDHDRFAKLQAIDAELRWANRCLSIIATGTIGALLYVLRPVLAPFVVAIFLTVGLRPILELLQRRLRTNRIVAVAIVFLLVVVSLVLLGGAIASSIDQLASDDAYQHRAAAVTEEIALIAERLNMLPSAGFEEGEVKISSGKRLRLIIRQGVGSARDWLTKGMMSLSGSLSVVLIYMLFLLLGASTPTGKKSELWDLIEGKLREYIVVKTMISSGTGIAVWLVLSVFGVPLAVLLGLLTFLLNYIPNFGPLVTCVVPLPVIWLSPDLSLNAMVASTVLACGVQVIGGNVVEPRIMGSSFELHPVVVMLALMVGMQSGDSSECFWQFQ